MSTINRMSNRQFAHRWSCTVDASKAGPGDLEISVNGGTVPCNVQPVGNRRFRASFTPRVAIPHDVEVKFNGQEVTGMCVSVLNLSLVSYTVFQKNLAPKRFAITSLLIDFYVFFTVETEMNYL